MIRTLLMILFATVMLSSAETTPEIRQMILEIKAASGDERYQKMNRFKQKLRQMNEQSRSAAISQLRTQQNKKMTKQFPPATTVKQTREGRIKQPLPTHVPPTRPPKPQLPAHHK